MNGLLAGEVAQRAGVSRDTLRYYERRGLLPAVPRGQNGYRRYPESTVARVRVIQRALEAGFTVAELAKILRQRDAGGAPCRQVYALAREHFARLEARLERLAALRDELGATLRDWERRLQHSQPGEQARLLEALPDGPHSAARDLGALLGPQHRRGIHPHRAPRRNPRRRDRDAAE